MIRYVLFSHRGSVRKGSGLDFPKPAKKEYLFLILTEAEKNEIDRISVEFGLNRRDMLGVRKNPRPKLYPGGPCQFIMQTSYLKEGKIEFASMGTALTDKCIIIVAQKNPELFERAIETIFESLKETKIESTITIFARFLQDEIERSYEVLSNTAERIRKLELKAAEIKREPEIKTDDIVYEKSILFNLGSQLWSTVKNISRIRLYGPQLKIGEDGTRMLTELQATIRHQTDMVVAQKEMISDALNIFTIGLSVRVTEKSHEANKTLKRLTGYSVILLVSGLIMGKLSMNIDNIPFAMSQLGFTLAISLIATLMLGTLLLVKKKQWL